VDTVGAKYGELARPEAPEVNVPICTSSSAGERYFMERAPPGPVFVLDQHFNLRIHGLAQPEIGKGNDLCGGNRWQRGRRETIFRLHSVIEPELMYLLK
jgi:hypothetical protein